MIILRMVSPFSLALATVQKAGILMTLMNAAGILLFISSFNNIFIRQDIESSRQLQMASELGRRCIPLLGNGLEDEANMKELVSVLLEASGWTGVILTDRERILAWKQRRMTAAGRKPSGRENFRKKRKIPGQSAGRRPAGASGSGRYPGDRACRHEEGGTGNRLQGAKIQRLVRVDAGIFHDRGALYD